MNTRIWIFSGLTLFSFLGIIDAGYLAYTALAGISPVCNFVQGCDLVAASSYSRVFGIPLAIFGVFFYSAIFGFALWGFSDKKLHLAQLFLFFTIPGFILSLYFLYLQAFIINAYCQYCLLSLLFSTMLFLLSIGLFYLERTKNTRIQDVVENHAL